MEDKTIISRMSCGHMANGYVDGNKDKPVCLSCLGFTHKAEIREKSPLPNLENRVSKCREARCKSTELSSFNLPFFTYLGDKKSEYDFFYCGCRGWE